MKACIYIEGAGTGKDSKEQKLRCQEAFHKLLARMGFAGRMPRLVACGGRGAVYDHFVTAHLEQKAEYVAMWLDSEDPVENPDETWAHLKSRNHWDVPEGAQDDQVLFMATCMETWIVADQAVLRKHYGNELQESALPPLANLENRDRHAVQDSLAHATRQCKNAYKKGHRSFDIFGKLTPNALRNHLPSFVRVEGILGLKL